ncbi:hypothetical protein [Nannocystis sp.]|uniref:hypothetical protein n=1 Tax=Nannocystis sp. TaxID=1962667 RepID=UPI0025E4F731|nr:hypothetical protein [Nannocystis sp.]MBK7823698.1 hypothetical protein [Nannocystis sp.]
MLDGNTPIASQAVAITLSEGTLVAAGEVTAQFPGDGYAFACADAATGTPETCLPGKYTRPTTMLETMPSGDIVVATDASVNGSGTDAPPEPGGRDPLDLHEYGGIRRHR